MADVGMVPTDLTMFIAGQNAWLGNSADDLAHAKMMGIAPAAYPPNHPSLVRTVWTRPGAANCVDEVFVYASDIVDDACSRASRYSAWLVERDNARQDLLMRLRHNIHNMKQPQVKDRWNVADLMPATSRRRYLAKRARFRVYGEIIGRFVRGEDVEDELVEQNDHELVELVMEVADDKGVHSPHVRVCTMCSNVVSNDDTYEVGGWDGHVCEDCVNDSDSIMWSSCMQEYLHGSVACPVFDSITSADNNEPDDWCTRRYGSQRFYEPECSVGNWARSFFSGWETRQEWDGYEDEDDDDDDGLADYHATSRYWVVRNSTPAFPTFGLEIEVYAEDRPSAVGDIRERYSWDDLILERDGSLSETCGFEVVTHPYGYTEWAEFGPRLVKTLRDAGCEAFAGDMCHHYGIHVNVDRTYFSPLAEARIMLFLTRQENFEFVRDVAQREAIYNPLIDIGSLAERDQRVVKFMQCGPMRDMRHLSHQLGGTRVSRMSRKITGAGKYCPVHVRTNVLEFRMFQSTLNTTSFMKNLDFVRALWAWTRVDAATGTDTTVDGFLTWLNKPENRKDYPYLIKYLSREKIAYRKAGEYGKDIIVHIPNQWKERLARCRTETELADEPADA